MNEKLKSLCTSVHLFEEKVITEDTLRRKLIEYLSDDDDIIPNLLQILEAERQRKRDLIQESNFELSRALVTLETKDLKDWKGGWVIGEIKKHYVKWKDYVKCCFKFDELP